MKDGQGLIGKGLWRQKESFELQKAPGLHGKEEGTGQLRLLNRNTAAETVKCTFVCSAPQARQMEWRGGSNLPQGLRCMGLLEAAGEGRQPAHRRGAQPLRDSPLHCPFSGEGPQQGREGQGSVQVPDFK